MTRIIFAPRLIALNTRRLLPLTVREAMYFLSLLLLLRDCQTLLKEGVCLIAEHCVLELCGYRVYIFWVEDKTTLKYSTYVANSRR